jgi:CRISPR-associated protein Cmr6
MRHLLFDIKTLAPDAHKDWTHLGLLLHRWAPAALQGDDAGKIPTDARESWFAWLERRAVPTGYDRALQRWRASFPVDGPHEVFTASATSRVLVGHGDKGLSEPGVTTSHAWGTPVIPGSALKGMLAHYIHATFGQDPRWRAPRWDGNRLVEPPGEHYRAIFGAAAMQGDDGQNEQGCVIFHDAWLDAKPGDTPWAIDVLTVHQKSYYDKKGEQGGPNDYNDPNPVSFLTVKPGTRFVFALSCTAPDWLKLAKELLCDALREWGVGAKTSLGYGRFKVG